MIDKLKKLPKPIRYGAPALLVLLVIGAGLRALGWLGW